VNEPKPPAAQAPAEAVSASASISGEVPHASGSFFYAKAHEANRRERLACAALGLEPPDEAFKGCVKDLKDTFHAIDNPIS
jgi:hypothetical protein